MGVEPTSAGTPADLREVAFTARWPLKVKSGTLSCKGAEGVGEVVFSSGGKTCAINGFAKSNPAYADIRPIWANDRELGLGLKKDIGPLIDRGLRLCK